MAREQFGRLHEADEEGQGRRCSQCDYRILCLSSLSWRPSLVFEAGVAGKGEKNYGHLPQRIAETPSVQEPLVAMPGAPSRGDSPLPTVASKRPSSQCLHTALLTPGQRTSQPLLLFPEQQQLNLTRHHVPANLARLLLHTHRKLLVEYQHTCHTRAQLAYVAKRFGRAQHPSAS